MIIKIKDIYKHLFLMSIFYMYTKDLLDSLPGGLFKLFFYAVVFVGIVMFFLETLIQTKKADFFVMIGFLSYLVYIIYNGKVLSNKEQFSQGMLEYVLYTFYFLAAVFYIRKGNVVLSDLKRFIYLGDLISVLALVEYVSKTSIIPADNYSIYYFAGGYSSFRARVFCVSPMTLCMMLGLLLLLSCYFVIVERDNKDFIFKCSPIILLIGMLCTGSRGPLIGTMTGVCVLIGLNWMKEPLTRHRGIKTLFYGSIIILFLIILQINGGLATIRTGIEGIDNIIMRFSSSTDFSNEWGNVARLEIWTEYIGVFLNNFWNGIGIAQTSSTVVTNVRRVTESGLLKRLVETGMIGFILYIIGVLLPIVKNTIAKRAHDTVTSSEKLLIVSVFFAIGIEDIVLQMFADVMAMYIFWSIVAVYYVKVTWQK